MDNDISLVMNGEFYVFGKITQVIKRNSDETINLLRKTALRSLGEGLIQNMTDAFDKIPDAGLDIPTITTKIKGPVIQVLPIAIFI